MKKLKSNKTQKKLNQKHMQMKIEEESSKYVMELYAVYSNQWIKMSHCRP